MAWKVATVLTGYIPSASAYVDEFPPRHVSLHNWPRRPWRAPDVTSHYLQLEFSGPMPIAALFLNHANFSGCVIRASDDVAFGSYTSVGTFQVRKDTRVQNRRKVICEFAAVATNRYIRIIPNLSSQDAGATGWELGQVAAVNDEHWREWPEPAAPPYRQTRAKAVTVDELPGATQYVTADGAAYFGADFGAELWTVSSGQWQRIMDLLNLGLNRPFILYENAGDRAHTYMLWRVGPATVSDEAGRIFGVNIPAREAI